MEFSYFSASSVKMMKDIVMSATGQSILTHRAKNALSTKVAAGPFLTVIQPQFSKYSLAIEHLRHQYHAANVFYVEKGSLTMIICSQFNIPKNAS